MSTAPVVLPEVPKASVQFGMPPLSDVPCVPIPGCRHKRKKKVGSPVQPYRSASAEEDACLDKAVKLRFMEDELASFLRGLLEMKSLMPPQRV